MRYIILVKATAASEAGAMPPPKLFAAVTDYHEALAKAGVLVDANGLQPTAKGWRIARRGGEKVVTDGPFAEPKEIVAGYATIEVASRQEALDWVSPFPNPALGDGQNEVRQMFELDDVGDTPGIQRFRQMEAARA